MPVTAKLSSTRLARSILVAGCLAAMVNLSGCVTLVTAAASMLGGMGGDGSGSAPTTQLGGAASQAQNQRVSDRTIREVLDYVGDEDVRESCVEQIPPEARGPVTHCTMRPTCIGGVRQPMMMQACPVNATVAQEGVRQETAVARVGDSDSVNTWQWD